MDNVGLKKYGVILGGCLNIFRLTKQALSFSIIAKCVLQRKKWGLFSGVSLQELQMIPESENFEVIFLKQRLYLKSLIINCFR